MRLIRGVALALAVSACSTSLSSFGEASGGATAEPTTEFLDASVAPVPNQPACSESTPREGDPCSDAPTACEYGDGAVPGCDDVFECVALNDYRWRRRVDLPAVCNACPSDFSDVTPGGACPQSGAVCTYYEAMCGCVGDSDAGLDPDAGATPGTWSCTRPVLGCPARRPRLGSPCVREMKCDYGSCLFGTSLSFECKRVSSQSVAWTQTDPPTCP